MRELFRKSAACVGLVLCGLFLTSARQLPPPNDSDDAPHQSQDTDSTVPPGCVKLFGSIQCGEEEPLLASRLLANGPQPETATDPLRPAVVSFVRNNWPFVIDFQAEPGTRTVLKVKLYHRRWILPYLENAYQQVLGEDEQAGERQVIKIEAIDLGDASVATGAGEVRVARYDIRSYRLDGDTYRREQGKLVRAPVKIFGIGAGPRAVGSITLRDVRFGPASLQIPAAGAPPAMTSFQYVLLRPYDVVSAGVERDCPGAGCRWAGQALSPSAGSVGLSPPRQWPVRRNAKPGLYRLQVRAWLNCQGSTPAERFVDCGDEAAWASGFSDDIVVER